MEIRVQKYTQNYEEAWDTFIENEALNGTFLQSRKFLNYHPHDRFKDCSIMFYIKDDLVAICPAAVIYDRDVKVFSSHPGSTYGGIIISSELFRAEKMLSLVDSFEKYLINEGFDRCILKQNNPLMDKKKMDLLEFCLFYNGFTEYKELDIYIDYNDYNTDEIIKNFSKLKKRQVKKCINSEMYLKEISNPSEIERFINILADNLQKYGLSPYHTVEDLIDLKDRFPKNIQFWGAIYNSIMIAESMVFLFPESGCVHTHYLAADPKYNTLSPMSFIYYSMIEKYKNTKYLTLSWGITTEHLGVELNKNLTNTKEEFGSKHNIVKIYEKEI